MGRRVLDRRLFVTTVGKHGNEDTIGNYVRKQGKKYQKLHEDRQLALF